MFEGSLIIVLPDVHAGGQDQKCQSVNVMGSS